MKRLKDTFMYLMMFRRLVTYAMDPIRVAITNSIPSFLNNITQLTAYIGQLDSLFVDYQLTSRGATAARQAAVNSLISFTYSVMSSVRAYANDNSLKDLATDMKITVGELKHKKLQDLTFFVTANINAVNAIIGNLAAYGVDVATMNQWTTLLGNVTALIPTPEAIRVGHKDIGILIEQKTTLVNNYVKNNLDPLATNFNIAHPDYYLGWRSNRKLYHVGIRHTRLNALVVDDQLDGIFSITVTINELTKDGRTFKAVSGTTGLDGSVILEKFEGGDRTVTISGPGIATKTFGPFHFEHGKAIDETFEAELVFDDIPPSLPEEKKEEETK